MAASFGVHIGHSSACLAVERDGRCDVVANDDGDRVTPAIVGWNCDEVLVGTAGKQLATRLPNAVIKDNKAAFDLGTSDEIRSSSAPFRLVTKDDGTSFYEIERDDGKTVKITPKQALKEIYKYMHDIAFSHASADVDEHSTVVTVPIEFGQDVRKIVAEAAQEAGFNVVQVISEPAAACLAYNLGQLDPLETYKCLVYRCGGSSITATVVQIQSGMVQILKSLTKRDFGGNKVTDLLVTFLADEFKRKYRADPRETKRGKQKLATNAESVKHILSTLDTGNCYIESLHEGIDFNCNVTRARFDNELAKILTEFINPIEEVLDLAKIQPEDIKKVILAGGTSKIPKVQKAVFAMFPHAEYLTSLNPDEVIAIGAANQASLIDEKVNFGDVEDKATHSVKLPAISQSLVYNVNDSEELVTLINLGCPVPVRRSNHVTINADSTNCVAKISLQSADGSLTSIAQLKLENLTGESKVSLSAHLHRDGSLHMALTDKASSSVDEVTLQ